jgi:hypothetical protein
MKTSILRSNDECYFGVEITPHHADSGARRRIMAPARSVRLKLRVERADVLRVRKAIVEFGGAGSDLIKISPQRGSSRVSLLVQAQRDTLARIKNLVQAVPMTFGRNEQAVSVPSARPGTKPDYFLVVTVVCMALMTALFAVPFVVRLLAQS